MNSIQIVTPAARHSRRGNRVTADRYARLLRSLKHDVRVGETLDDEPADLLIALHARKSAKAIRQSRRRNPDQPIVLVLTGTDLYQDLATNRPTRESMENADRLVVLQSDAPRFVPKSCREKTRVIFQSCVAPSPLPEPLRSCFEVCVSGHLRSVKDPFRAEAASRLLPAESRIRITHIGAAMTDAMRASAERRMRDNSRYNWRGEVPRAQARRILARSRVLVISSKLEGGANVVSEAIAAGVPVLASRISGNIGMLGDNYIGYYDFAKTDQLTEIMYRAESVGRYYRELQSAIKRLQPLVAPDRERDGWATLLSEL